MFGSKMILSKFYYVVMKTRASTNDCKEACGYRFQSCRRHSHMMNTTFSSSSILYLAIISTYSVNFINFVSRASLNNCSECPVLVRVHQYLFRLWGNEEINVSISLIKISFCWYFSKDTIRTQQGKPTFSITDLSKSMTTARFCSWWVDHISYWFYSWINIIIFKLGNRYSIVCILQSYRLLLSAIAPAISECVNVQCHEHRYLTVVYPANSRAGRHYYAP